MHPRVRTLHATSPQHATSPKESSIAHIVAKTEIAKNGDYNLSGERYRVNETINAKFPVKLLSEVAIINPVKSQIKDLPEDTEVSFVPMADLNENQISFEPKEIKRLKEVFNGYTYFQDDDVLMAKVTPCFENGKAGLAKNLKNAIGFGSSEFYVLRASEAILPRFLYYLVSGTLFKEYGVPKMTGTGGLRRVPKDVIANFQIPLPPLSIQEEIVAEIEGYQKVIDGAKAIVANYKPKIDIDPDWEMVELGEIFDKITTSVLPAELKESEVNYVGLDNISQGSGELIGEVVSNPKEIKSTKTVFTTKHILYGKLRPNLNKVYFSEIEGICSTDIFVLEAIDEAEPKFYAYHFLSKQFNDDVMKGIKGAQLPRVGYDYFSKIIVPKPTLETQRQIVAQIEKEQALVNANKQLIEIFEQKIKDRIAKVWGTSASSAQAEKTDEEKLSIAAEPAADYEKA